MQTDFHYGLPVRCLPQALLWAPEEVVERRRSVEQIPSWAWAAWKGHLIYNHPFLNDGLNPVIGTLVEIFVVDSEEHMTPMRAEERWFSKPLSMDEFEVSDNLETGDWGGLDSRLPESATRS